MCVGDDKFVAVAAATAVVVVSCSRLSSKLIFCTSLVDDMVSFSNETCAKEKDSQSVVARLLCQSFVFDDGANDDIDRKRTI